MKIPHLQNVVEGLQNVQQESSFTGKYKIYKKTLGTSSLPKTMQKIEAFINAAKIDRPKIGELTNWVSDIKKNVALIHYSECNLFQRIFFWVFPKKRVEHIKFYDHQVEQVLNHLQGVEGKNLCRQAKEIIYASKEKDISYKDDRFIRNLLENREFKTFSAQAIKKLFDQSEVAAEGLKELRLGINEFLTTLPRDNIPDGYRTDVAIAMVIAAAEIVDDETFGKCKEYFEKKSLPPALDYEDAVFALFNSAFLVIGGICAGVA